MLDSKKVIKDLTDIYDEAYDRWVHRPYIEDKLVTLIRDGIPDALALLREQEPQEPHYCEADDSWSCGNCGETVGYGEYNPLGPVRNKYCKECGKRVQWI